MKLKGIWTSIAILIIGIIYYFFNPSSNALFPKCPFLTLTGFTCPGCGSQRAIHSLLHLNVADAIKCNLLLVLSLPIITVLFYAELKRKSNPAFYIKVHQTKYIWLYFSLVIIWWIVRNIFHL